MYDLVDWFEKEHKLKYSQNTLDAYKIGILGLMLWCQKAVEDILTFDIKNWMDALKEDGICPNSLRVKLAGVRAFYNFLYEEKIIDNDPSKSSSLKIANVLPNKRKRLSEDQIYYMRDALKSDVKNRAIFEILYSTAIRISELVNIKRNDVLWKEDLIIIRVAKGNSQRYALISNECRVSLKNYLATLAADNPNPYLFPGRKKDKSITRQGVWKMLTKYSKSIDSNFKCTPHRIRRTTGYKLLKEGMKYAYVMWILGHSNPLSTQIYIEDDE